MVEFRRAQSRTIARLVLIPDCKEPAARRGQARLRVARVGAAFRRIRFSLAIGIQAMLANPPDLVRFTRRLSTTRAEGKLPKPQRRQRRGVRSQAAPKRHEVGRVARRARPVISSLFCHVPRLTLKAGCMAQLGPPNRPPLIDTVPTVSSSYFLRK